MRLEEYGFRDYYHSYMILEADSLKIGRAHV